MDFKDQASKVGNKLKSFWDTNILQRTSRITYDVVANILLFFLVVGTMIFLFAGGVGAGYFVSLVKDEPLRDYDEMRNDIYNYEETTKLYFAGNKYIADVRSELHRDEIPLEKVSELSIQAVIATEDQEFYEHNGVVPKAIVRALFQEVANTDTKSGGSTLTQQLIKNQILTNEVSFERKAKEMLLAMRLESFFEKDEILEAYVNIVPYGRDAAGRNIAGIQAAAKGIFDVNADELILPQAAFIAGLPQNPYKFTPYQPSGEIKEKENLQAGLNRMNVVLKRMYENNVINEEEYEQAKEHDITADFKARSRAPIDRYPALVFDLEKRAKKIIMEILAEEDEYTMEDFNKTEKDGYTQEEAEESKELKEQYEILAERDLRKNGYHIHSSIDKKIYDTMQKVAKDYPHYGPDRTFTDEDADGNAVQKTEQVEVGATLIENSTGRVLGYIPGRDFSLESQINHTTHGTGRSPGSTIKPLVVYGPGFELGLLQPGTVLEDLPIKHGDWEPQNVTKLTYGLVSAREALTYSYNIATIDAYKKIIHENPAKNFLMKMGYKNLNAERQENLSLAIGSTEVTVEDNTNSFATFGNGGNFVESTIIDKITTADGEIVYEHTPESERIFSEQTSYLVTDLMRDVLRSGTGTYLSSQINNKSVDWAGKTGTSNFTHDGWFIGTNPSVTLGVWIGYDTPASIDCKGCSLSYSQRSQNLWARIINNLEDINPELITPNEEFKQPSGIVNRSYCATSGLKPSKLCKDVGLVKSDIYNADFVPSKVDDSLVGGNMALVEIDGEMVSAGPKTPSEFTTAQKGGIAFNPDFLESIKSTELDSFAQLIPRRNPAPGWKKISFDGKALTEVEDSVANSAPPKPGSLKQDNKNIVWSHAKNKLIVGYRIYYAAEEGKSFSKLTHTKKTSFAIPKKPGVYHVKAVNYSGLESEPSAKFIIEPEVVEKPEEEAPDKEVEEPEDKPEKEKDKDKDKEKNKEKDKDKDKDKEKDKEKDKN